MYKYLFVAVLPLLLSACISNNTPIIGTGSATNTPTETRISKMIPSPSFGSGTHTVTVFADFQCPACIRFAHIYGKALDELSTKGTIRVIYKQFPLYPYPHQNSLRDAIAGLCGAEQGKYGEGKKALYALEEKKAGADVSDSERVDALVGAGLDRSSLEVCLRENRYQTQIETEMKEAAQIGINSTPTVMIDGMKLDLGIFSNEEDFRKFFEQMSSVPTILENSTGTGEEVPTEKVIPR